MPWDSLCAWQSRRDGFGAEPLSIQPVLEGYLWQPGLSVQGDVYTFAQFSGAACWRTSQRETGRPTSLWCYGAMVQGWDLAKIIDEGRGTGIAGVDYEAGAVLAYPNAEGGLYR